MDIRTILQVNFQYAPKPYSDQAFVETVANEGFIDDIARKFHRRKLNNVDIKRYDVLFNKTAALAKDAKKLVANELKQDSVTVSSKSILAPFVVEGKAPKNGAEVVAAVERDNDSINHVLNGYSMGAIGWVGLCKRGIDEARKRPAQMEDIFRKVFGQVPPQGQYLQTLQPKSQFLQNRYVPAKYSEWDEKNGMGDPATMFFSGFSIPLKEYDKTAEITEVTFTKNDLVKLAEALRKYEATLHMAKNNLRKFSDFVMYTISVDSEAKRIGTYASYMATSMINHMSFLDKTQSVFLGHAGRSIRALSELIEHAVKQK